MSPVSEGEPIRHFRFGLGVSVWILATKTDFPPSFNSHVEDDQHR
jgi:hypothetical protein